MFARGVPILQIKENLGHEDLATTQIYAHLLPPEGEAM
jgi:integrase/recombinase XerC